jgi:ABC-type phosphate transport system substrate-binding protein
MTMKMLLAVFILLTAASLVAQSADVAVVVNKKNPVTNVSSVELKRILSGEKRFWPGGTAVKLLIRDPGTAERTAYLHLLSMSEKQYKEYWTEMVFKGQVDSDPVMVYSNGMQKEAAVNISGAVVLMNAADVKGDVKILRVDSLEPGNRGYPVH